MNPMSELSPLILTLKLDQKTFNYFNQLRQQHFPPERNFLPAHVTLFHSLPAEQESTLQQTLQELCSRTPMLSLTFERLRFLGKGVSAEVNCSELIQLRQQLAARWNHWLSRQDQQSYRPHVTLQNKVAPDQARLLCDQLTREWKPLQGKGEGLLLWYYKSGPWELANQFDFK